MDAAEADFQRFYGLDLSVELDRICVRRLWVLMFHMPDGAWAALMRERNSKSRAQSVSDLDVFFGGLSK